MHVWLIIVISFCALYCIVPQKYVGWLFFATTLALAVMAFYCVPKETDDLSRYFKEINALRKGGWNDFQDMLSENHDNWGSLPVCGYYFFLISRFDSNGYLPAITIFLAYGSAFYIFYKASVRFSIGKWYLFLCCFFFLSTYWFYDICSGVRNGLAFTLFSACIYQDVVEKKHRWLCYIGYFLCVGLHSSTIVFAFIRLSLWITKKYGSKLMSWFMVFAITIGCNFFIWLGEHTDISYFQLLSEKAEVNLGRYIGLGDITQTYVNLLVFIVVAVWSIYLSKYIKTSVKSDEFGSFFKFYTIMMFFVGGCVSSGLLFVRMVRWVIPIFGSLVFMIGMQYYSDDTERKIKLPEFKSIVRSSNYVATTNILIINLLFVSFTAVHLWYACNGTSLLWLKFS